MTVAAVITPEKRHEALGLWLGFVGVFVFALTLPMTRLATGTADAPQLSPWFVTWGRAALAGWSVHRVPDVDTLALAPPRTPGAPGAVAAGQCDRVSAAPGLGVAGSHGQPCGGDHRVVAARDRGSGGLADAPAGAAGLLAVRRAGQRAGRGVQPIAGAPARPWVWPEPCRPVAAGCCGRGFGGLRGRSQGHTLTGRGAGDQLGVRDGLAHHAAWHLARHGRNSRSP